MLNTLPSLPLPDLPIKETPEYKVSETQYGDGYKQIAQDGVNATTWRVDLSWSNINQSERDIIVTFLQAHAPAVPFYYTTTNRPQRPYTCKDWSDTEVDAGFYNVVATLIENHGASV